MYINPKVAIEEGWITHPDCSTYQDWVDRKFVSPNAIDFPLDVLFTINDRPFHISEQGKKMRGGSKVTPLHDRREDMDYWSLAPHSIYDGMSHIFVTVPEGVVVPPLVVRSSFSRNGIFLTSGIYDSGFEGHIGFLVHNRGSDAHVAVGTRIGQIAFVTSDNATTYEGGWNHANGTHYSEKE